MKKWIIKYAIMLMAGFTAVTGCMLLLYAFAWLVTLSVLLGLPLGLWILVTTITGKWVTSMRSIQHRDSKEQRWTDIETPLETTSQTSTAERTHGERNLLQEIDDLPHWNEGEDNATKYE